MHFGFMDVILLRNHQHVSATHGDICSVVRTRMQIIFVFLMYAFFWVIPRRLNFIY